MKSDRAGKLVESSLELFDNDSSQLVHKNFGSQASIQERGAIFTRLEVVEFILDLVEFTADKKLYEFRILEPSVGDGDFLFPVVDRLLKSIKDQSVDGLLDHIGKSIVAIEIHEETVIATRKKLVQQLLDDGRFNEKTADSIAGQWIIHSDFLLFKPEGQFNFIVGNPPYVRQELIPEGVLREYKRKFTTIYDRSDLYIPFIEHSLNLLAADGLLGFICSDRWLKNKYGGPLRDFISRRFHLKYYVDMTETNAFHADVIAYPAITVFGRGRGKKTRVACRPRIERKELSSLSERLVSKLVKQPDIAEVEIHNQDSGPWILTVNSNLELLRKLEGQFPLIEEAGCKIGIGVATGADKVFIRPYDELDIEPDRKLPLAMTKDIESGAINWRGYGVVNPYNDDGSLVRLRDFPKLKKYLDQYKQLILARHVARNNPENWFKTIDRIYAPLTITEKLFIPDIKGSANIVYDKGEYYPHHNLYYITSSKWDLKILQAILCSGIATFFVSSYSTHMRGGYLRFQAQYLRRIRIPSYDSVTTKLRSAVYEASASGNNEEMNNVIFDLYNLTNDERNKIKLK